MDFNRRKTRKIKVGNAFLGGNSSVKIQSMLNIPAEDIKGNVAQAAALEKAGCEIIRHGCSEHGSDCPYRGA